MRIATLKGSKNSIVKTSNTPVNKYISTAEKDNLLVGFYYTWMVRKIVNLKTSVLLCSSPPPSKPCFKSHQDWYCNRICKEGNTSLTSFSWRFLFHSRCLSKDYTYNYLCLYAVSLLTSRLDFLRHLQIVTYVCRHI